MRFVKLLRSGDFGTIVAVSNFREGKWAGGFVLAKGGLDFQKNLQSLRCGGNDECRFPNFYDRAIFGAVVAVSVFREGRWAGGFVLAKGGLDFQKNLQSLRCGGNDECGFSNFYDWVIFGSIVAVSIFRYGSFPTRMAYIKTKCGQFVEATQPTSTKEKTATINTNNTNQNDDAVAKKERRARKATAARKRRRQRRTKKTTTINANGSHGG